MPSFHELAAEEALRRHVFKDLVIEGLHDALAKGFRAGFAACAGLEAYNAGGIWRLVILDMQARDKIGCERYGTPLQAHNGRDALQDAYEEALDLCVYLRQAIEERNKQCQPAS